MFLKFSITSQLDMALPVVVGGICTDIPIRACGLRYKLCGRYSGSQSDTFFTVWIFIVAVDSFIFRMFLYLYFVSVLDYLLYYGSSFGILSKRYLKNANTTESICSCILEKSRRFWETKLSVWNVNWKEWMSIGNEVKFWCAALNDVVARTYNEKTSRKAIKFAE